jgi:predicted metal-dependent phosphoesterase TrpH
VRCDLHIHSLYSGQCTLPVLNRICRESYSPPEAVYETLRQRGMDLVTLTDHDSIRGAEALLSHRGTFLSEEVTCTAPSGTELHVGVYGISEGQHIQLQQRRSDLPRFLAYLREQRLFAAVNHPFSALTGRRNLEDFAVFARFAGVEVLNAHLAVASNLRAEQFAERHSLMPVGGSDAHTLASAGSAWTEVPGARNPEEFLLGLRHGQARVAGRSGTYAKMTRDVLRIALAMMAESPWSWMLAPLLVAAPVVTLGNVVRERAFVKKWVCTVLEDAEALGFGAKSAQSEESAA